MNDYKYTTEKNAQAFTLIETIIVLSIATMIMMATLTIYGRVKTAAASMNRALNKNVLATEILQRIAEDLDRLASPGLDTKITIRKKPDSSGYDLVRMVIENKIVDKDNKPQIFERVIWQTDYDFYEDAIILYRLHGGLALEDRVTAGSAHDEPQELDEELFIPLCSGITFFSIDVLIGDNLQGQWTANSLPKAITAGISFAEPVENFEGEFEILETEIVTRTIAIDRTRKINYRFIKKDFTKEGLEETDPNKIDADETGDEQEGDEQTEGQQEKTEKTPATKK